MKNLMIPLDINLPPVTKLISGAITCFYEQGRIRYVRVNGNEIVRMIYTAVRDENWKTAPYTISNEKIVQRTDGFNVHYTASYSYNSIRYKAEVEINCFGNSLSFEMRGEALSDFMKNRIGICIHHPVNFSTENSLTIVTPSGDVVEKKFPQLISPHQPAENIQQMIWSGTQGELIKIEFAGDIFETEDQRNWSDSSFKTYSTPLELEFPVQIKAGEKMYQQVNVVVNDKALKKATKSDSGTKRPPVSFPKIGIAVSANNEGESLVGKTICNYLRVELDMSGDKWQEELNRVGTAIKEQKPALQLVCFFTANYDEEIENCIKYLREKDYAVYSLLVLNHNARVTDEASLLSVSEKIKSAFPAIKVGYGTNGHFADLNRNILHNKAFDFVGFTLTPQAHSPDPRSILENLDNQRDIVNTLRHHFADIEIHVMLKPLQGEVRNTFFECAWTIATLHNLSSVIISMEVVPHSPLCNFLNQLQSFAPVTVSQVPTTENGMEYLFENAAQEQFSVISANEYVTYRK